MFAMTPDTHDAEIISSACQPISWELPSWSRIFWPSALSLTPSWRLTWSSLQPSPPSWLLVSRGVQPTPCSLMSSSQRFSRRRRRPKRRQQHQEDQAPNQQRRLPRFHQPWAGPGSCPCFSPHSSSGISPWHSLLVDIARDAAREAPRSDDKGLLNFIKMRQPSGGDYTRV